jgi:medium-chain acyl-[acyl-carrier-protein] hydrolase
MPEDANRIISLRAAPAADRRLVCFPHAGGGADGYRKWAQGFDSSIEILAYEPPGRGRRIRETARKALAEVVEDAADALSPVLETKRFAFFGYSMGALIAFELARWLRRAEGAVPLCLFVVACPAPHRWQARTPVHRLPDAAIIEGMRSSAGTPGGVLENPDLMDLLLPVLRADLEACETFRPLAEDPLTVPLVVLGGREDGSVSGSELRSWREHTSEDFLLETLPGAHFLLHERGERVREIVIRQLEAAGIAHG